jgi:UDP-2,4-diacetamido-2,4,6-trideoxy-beta-L-altropyranose hydrolase
MERRYQRYARRAVVRADASSSLGTGHVMRCLTLALELRQRGWAVSFAMSAGVGDLRDLVASLGFELVAPEHLTLAPRKAYGWLIVDHYGIDAEWLRRARSFASRILVIDDLANRPLVADVLLDPNLDAGWVKYRSRIKGRPRTLFGPRYAMVRPEFVVADEELRPIRATVERVAIAMGGADPANATRLALLAVREALPRAHVDVIVGPAFSHPPPAEEPGLRILRSPSSVAAILREADLVVGAGGTSALERCALGVPSVIIRLAENQVGVAEGLARTGAAIDIGSLHGLDVQRLVEAIRDIASRPELRARMRDAGRRIVDGRGTRRVANAIDPITLRPARWDDADLLLGWANDPITRQYSLSTEPIPKEVHLAWLRSRLRDPNCDLLIGEGGRGPVGQLRLDVRQDVGLISIGVAPEARGGTGRSLLEAGLRRWRRKYPGLLLRAVVRSENEASRRLFEGCGFVPRHEVGGLIEYQCRHTSTARNRRAFERRGD